MSRHVIRTQKNNKLRMEDWEGEEHIKLSTEHSGKSQLTLGHMVDSTRQKRGEGFELRTSGYGAIRAGKGMLISAYDQPSAGGMQLDMQVARAELAEAVQMMRGLEEAAQAAQAHANEVDKQRELLAQRLDKLQKAVILLCAPDGSRKRRSWRR
jgi:type VI secretion system secreted protein VgrG